MKRKKTKFIVFLEVFIFVSLILSICFFSFLYGVQYFRYSDDVLFLSELVFVGHDDLYFDDLLAFLGEDGTNEREYCRDSFNCVEFARVLIFNASLYGITGYPVVIRWRNQSIGHQIVGFLTVDKGWIFVEPQSNRVLDIFPGAVVNGKVVERFWVLAGDDEKPIKVN